MAQLTGRQRKHLRGLAHGRKPVCQIGKNGIAEGVVTSLDQALEDHELIKVKFLDLKDQKAEACAEIVSRTGSAHVGTIGHVAIFYRPATEPERREIVLPAA